MVLVDVTLIKVENTAALFFVFPDESYILLPPLNNVGAFDQNPVVHLVGMEKSGRKRQKIHNC